MIYLLMAALAVGLNFSAEVLNCYLDGKRTVIANAPREIIATTDTVFGIGAGDQETLYVVTDGGALGGDLKARGTFVALKIRCNY